MSIRTTRRDDLHQGSRRRKIMHSRAPLRVSLAVAGAVLVGLFAAPGAVRAVEPGDPAPAVTGPPTPVPKVVPMPAAWKPRMFPIGTRNGPWLTEPAANGTIWFGRGSALG